MEWIVLAWLGMLGGCVGSFMNVVVYRLPAGKSLLRPGSRCPRCEHPIRWYHNLPILGWLLLRGKCYDCHAPIAVRYPWVEAAVAALFVAMGLVVFLFGSDATIWRLADRHLWAIYVSLAVTTCSLLCITLIRVDKARVPMTLYLVLGASGCAWAFLLWQFYRLQPV